MKGWGLLVIKLLSLLIFLASIGLAQRPILSRVFTTGQQIRVEMSGGAYSGAWIVEVGQLTQDGEYKVTARQGSRSLNTTILPVDGGIVIGPFQYNNLLPHFCTAVVDSNYNLSNGKLYEIRDRQYFQVGDCGISLVTTSAASHWPPSYAIGDTVEVDINANGVSVTWSVRIEKKGSEGSDIVYEGTMAQGNRRSSGGLVVFGNDILVLGPINVDGTDFVCSVVGPQSRSTYQGTVYRLQEKTEAGICYVRLGRPSSASPAPAPAQPARYRNWMSILDTGQVWTLEYSGSLRGSWAITLERFVAEGGYVGRATSHIDNSVVAITFMIDEPRLLVGTLPSDPRGRYVCVFTLQGSSLSFSGSLIRVDALTNQMSATGTCQLERR